MDLKLSRMIVSRTARFCTAILGDTADAHRKKFIPELMVGMAKSGTVVVAGIARETQREGETTLASWKSIRHQLNSRLWDKREEAMNRAFAREQGRWVDERTPILVDLSDLQKRYARKMDYLGRVRDADESARQKTEVIRPGYWLFESYAFGWDEETPVPLVDFVYSLEEGRFPSENAALEFGFRGIHEATGGKGIVVMDRRADAEFVLETFDGLPMAFCVRMRGDRTLYDGEGRELGDVRQVAQGLNPQGSMVLKRRKGRRTLKIRVEYASREVRVSSCKRPCYLVAVHGTFKHMDRGETEGWWYLLTTEPTLRGGDVERVIRWYRLRWKAEEAIQFLKEELGLEQVRVLRFRRIRRLVQIAFWVMALLAEVMAGLSQSTLHKLYRLGQVLRVVTADFLLYRIRRAISVFFRDPDQFERLLGICGRI